MGKTDQIVSGYERFVIPTYTRNPIVLAKGDGSRVWDVEGREYLDFFPGWGVNGIGHCHPRVVAAVQAQANRLLHVPNNYYNELQGLLAERISAASFPGKCFFCNSGAEAVEAAIKLARRWGTPKGKTDFVTMERSFHGRTLAAITATGQAKYQKGFEPLVPGFRHIPMNDLDALRASLTEKTCAVVLEPIQGEGGIKPATAEYLQAVRKLCDEKEVLLLLDEVQTGMGRTGRYFAYQHYDIIPDAMTLAKALGGGVPIGALVARSEIADVLQPGTHASTFGGNPLACAAALAVFEAIEEENLLHRAREMGDLIRKGLEGLRRDFPVIEEIRGIGLMLGMEMASGGPDLVARCMEKGLLLNCTQEKVIRFMPAMTVSEPEIEGALAVVRDVLTEMQKKAK